MLAKALLFTILGVTFVLSLPDRGEYHHEDNEAVGASSPKADTQILETEKPKKVDTGNSTKVPTAESRWHRIRRKFGVLKKKCKRLFNEVQRKWHVVTNEVHKLDESFSKAKNRTLKLISNAQVLFKKLVIDGEHVFQEFDEVCDDLKMSIKDLKEEGGQFYEDVNNLLKELKTDMADIKNDMVNGELEKLKGSWGSVKHKWTEAETSFHRMFNVLMDDYHKTKNDTRVSIHGVKKDFKGMKLEVNELLVEAKKTYKEIIVDGKDGYAKFERAYEELVQILDTLKPEFDDICQGLKNLLSEFKFNVQQHEKFAELKAAHVGSDSVVTKPAA